jgi:hypothetical protein
MPSARPRSVVARLVRGVTALSLTVLATVAVQAPAAQAAQPLDCAEVYSIEGAGDRRVWTVDLSSGNQSQVGSFSGISGTGNLNGLGLTGNGEAAYGVHDTAERTIYRYDRATDTTTALGPGEPGAKITHGAVNPDNGHYYYGGFDNGQLTVYGFNTTTNKSMGLVASGTVPTGGGNGDWTFDRQGHLFVVGGANGVNIVTAIDRGIPASAPDVKVQGRKIAEIRTGSSGNINGIAFAGSGYLYLSSGATLFKVNPSSGAVEETHAMTPGGSVDLASCASPTTITVQGSFPDQRVSASDQTTVTVTGGGISSGNTGTTSGTDDGAQDGADEAAGPVFGLAGETYTITASGPGTVEPQYTTEWTCVDQNNGSLIESGTGTTGSFTMPDKGADGVAASCTFTNAAQIPAVSLDKQPGTLSGTTAGST